MYECTDQKVTTNNISYNINDVTIIMEGICKHVDILKICKSYKYLCKQIIISSYLTLDKINKLKKKIPNILILNNNIHMVESKTKEIYNKKGAEQFHHMHNALPFVTTKYVVKTRVDQIFYNFNYFIDMIVNNEKVIMFPLYVRGALSIKYHPSDMLFGCSTQKMKEIWFNHHQINTGNSEILECAIWKGWMDLQANNMGLKQIDEMSQSDYGDFCSKIFIIFDERKLRPYSFKGKEINHDTLKTDIPDVKKFRLYNENISPEKNTFKYFSSKGCDIDLE